MMQVRPTRRASDGDQRASIAVKVKSEIADRYVMKAGQFPPTCSAIRRRRGAGGISGWDLACRRGVIHHTGNRYERDRDLANEAVDVIEQALNLPRRTLFSAAGRVSRLNAS